MTASPTPGPDPRQHARALAEASPAEVRAALIPEEQVEFERDWKQALAHTKTRLGL